MNTLIKNLAFATIISAGFIACNDKVKEAETTDAQMAASATEAAEMYTVKNENSTIKWEGNKPTGTHLGTIALKDGSFSLKDGMVEGGEFTIDMTSINVTDLDESNGKESLEAHLMGTVDGKEGDFFNVKQYPTATFVVTGTEMSEGKTYMMGNLTIKDKTNNIKFPVTIKDDGQMVRIISEQFAIDRTKWGVNYGSKSVFDNLGDKFIDDDMKITFELVAAK